MPGRWKRKYKHECSNCHWTGQRAVSAKHCPRCNHWHPVKVAKSHDQPSIELEQNQVTTHRGAP